jgi:hypothetical protein
MQERERVAGKIRGSLLTFYPRGTNKPTQQWTGTMIPLCNPEKVVTAEIKESEFSNKDGAKA